MKTKVKIGDKVVWHTGFMGAEQGQRHDTWWAEDKYGVVISYTHEKVLIEFEDGERSWANISKVEKEISIDRKDKS